jgi:peptide chain release factor 1
MSMFDKLDAVVKRYEELTEKMADPTLYDRQKEFKQVSEERSNIEELVQCYKNIKRLNDLDGAKEFLKSESDEEMREMAKEEISEYEARIPKFLKIN